MLILGPFISKEGEGLNSAQLKVVNLGSLASLQNDHVRDNDDIQGFGSRFDSNDIKTLDDLPLIGGDADARSLYQRTYIRPKQLNLLPGIQTGQSKVVNFRPLCGLLHQSHHLPLKFVPITLELELADRLDPIITPFDYDLASTWNTTLTVNNAVDTWQIRAHVLNVIF